VQINTKINTKNRLLIINILIKASYNIQTAKERCVEKKFQSGLAIKTIKQR
jgi:hypothetical protein